MLRGGRKSGDLNCDRAVNNSDIPAFVLALIDPGAYEREYPGCNRLTVDINRDGTPNNADIPPFVELLTRS